MELGYRHMLLVEALTEALDRVAQESMPLELLQEKSELVLGNMDNMFRPGLTDESMASALPMMLRWRLIARAVKTETQVYPPEKR